MSVRHGPIPEAALDKHVAFLGANGSGKTSAAKAAIIEPALEAGERVLNIDPTGVGWGLRVSKSGKGAGYPIAIFGGEHADYPLHARDAAMLAEAYGTSSGSAVFDTSLMTVEARTQWFIGFAETLLRKNRGKLKLVIDEAHLFMPQAGSRVGGLVPKMLHAGNNLISLGRSKGLRITLISQRPAKLHKDSLSQAKTLVAMQMMAPQDRAAIEEWIADQADENTGREIIASLPSLAPGEAWVWFPGGRYLERVRFARPSTFDSSAAPEDDAGDGPKLAPINLDALKGKLATIEAETKANDPAALKAEVAKLKAELAKKPAVPVTDDRATEHAFNSGHHFGTKAAFDALRPIINSHVKAIGKLRMAIDQLSGLALNEHVLIDGFEAEFEKLKSVPSADDTARPPSARSSPEARASSPPGLATGGGDDLPGPERRILSSLASWRAMGHENPSNAQVAWLAGYSPSSTSFTNPRSALKTKGLIVYPSSGHVSLTPDGAGMAAADPPADLRAFVLAQLPGPEARILKVAIERYPDAAGNEFAAVTAGYSHTSTSYTNPRSALKTKELVTYPSGGYVRAADWLFSQ